MHIRKRSDGRYEAIIITDNIRKSIYAKTKKELKEKIKEFKSIPVVYEKSTEIDPLINYSDYCHEYIKNYKHTGKQSSYDRIYSIYKVHIKNEKIFKVRISDINDIIIQSNINSKKDKLSYSSIKKIYQLHCAVLNYAFVRKDIEYDIAKIIKLPKEEVIMKETKVIEPYYDDEIKKIYAYINSDNDKKLLRYSGIIPLMINTSMRIGEVLALDKDSIDLEKRNIKIQKNLSYVYDESKGKKVNKIEKPKTKKSIRNIPLNQAAVQAIEDIYKKNNEYGIKSKYLICNYEGERMKERSVQQTVKRIIENAGVEYKGTHAFRHTFVMKCIEAGIDLKTISEICGHSGIMITFKRYAHITEERKEKAVNRI